MTEQELNLANSIKEEIRELEMFISTSEKVWKGKLTKETSKYVFKSIGYGIYSETEYNMNTEIKNKVLDVLRAHLKDLKNQFDNLGKGGL